ncbi:MAG TPA: hypothetical protein VI636_05245 [Candidatus Angelobacter sp.]
MTALYRRALLAGAMAFLLFPWTASAQAGGKSQDDQQQSGPQNDQVKRRQNQQRFALLTQKLNLTDDQKRQWVQINRETGQKIRVARKDDSLNEEQMQAQLKEIHKQHNQQLFAILTPEQQAELKAFWEEQKQKQQSDNSNAGPASQATDGSKDKQEDDLFAGMVPDPAPEPVQKKKAAAPK